MAGEGNEGAFTPAKEIHGGAETSGGGGGAGKPGGSYK